MSEGGVDILERRNGPDLVMQAWNSASGEKDWLETLEKKIIEDSPEKPLDIPKHVVRNEESWEQFGWNAQEKEAVATRLEEVLYLKKLLDLGDSEEDTDRLEFLHDNVMEMLLTSGKKPQELLNQLTQSELDRYRNHVKGDPDGRQSENLSSREEAMAQRYMIQNITGDEKHDGYLERFVYSDIFRDKLFNDYQRNRPQNLYELAWQISFSDKDQEEAFGVNGEYPILEMRVDTDGKNVTGGRYVVNQGNFMRWMRERIMHWQDLEEHEYVDYLDKVELKKELGSIKLAEIISDEKLYFTDESGQFYDGLAKQTLLEASTLAQMRRYHFIYLNSMSNEKKLVEEYGKMFADNKLTRKTLGKSRMYYNATIPLDFEGTDSDTTLGSAANTAFLAFYNFSDYEQLQKILGEDSSFFTRTGMEASMKTQLVKKIGRTGALSQDSGTLLGSDVQLLFEKAFTENYGKTNAKKVDHIPDTKENKKYFIQFINYFADMKPNHNQKDVVTTALKTAIGEQYDFTSTQRNRKKVNKEERAGKQKKVDEYSLDVAFLIAESQTLYTGAGAKNDPGGAAFNGFTKLLKSETYRRKMATESRGNAMGNPFTVAQFKMFSLDFLRAINVAESTTIDANGKKPRKKTPLEVMEEMRFVEMHHKQSRKKLEEEIANHDASSDARKARKQELVALNKIASKAYKRIAGQLEFNENTMVNYVANHLARGEKIYQKVMGAEQIPFEKFTDYDPLTRSVSFKRAEFQKEIQEDFNKQLRYMIETYGQLNLSMNIRTTVFGGRDKYGKDIWLDKTVPLGEAMFGYELLNIKEFRKREKIVGPDGKEKEGKYITKNGKYVIDYNKVDGNKTLVWKQMALMKIGADLWSHIDRYSKDPKYNIGYFMNVLDAIESIPSEILGDEANMKGTVFGENVFSKEQMQWLKKLTKTTNFSLFWRGLWNDSKHRSEGGFSESFSIFVNAVVRGY